MDSDAIRRLAGLFRRHPGALVLTGAGISTESGIPDFRTPGTGLYHRIDPMEYLSANALHRHPARFWKYFAQVFGPVTESLPNRGHAALARLEEAGLVAALATQNIDGLHQKAGSTRVFEVHGHLRTVRCDRCGEHHPMGQALDQVSRDRLPECPRCRGALRPDVVLFGDMMADDFLQAAQAARRAPLVLVVGSSLTVSPANTLAFGARSLAIINREPTPADGQAQVVIRGGAGETLEALALELGIAECGA